MKTSMWLIVLGGLALLASRPMVFAWQSDGWAYRQRIDFNTNAISGTFTNFPVLIALTNAASILWSTAQANGNDIVFTLNDRQTKLAHELETYNPASSQLWAWVKLPLLSAASNTSVYLYFGNPNSTNQSAAADVWVDYAAVWHLGTNSDSTTNANNGTTQGAATQTAMGKISGAYSFPGGAGDYIDCGTGNSLNRGTNDFTVEAWIFPTNDVRGGVYSKGRDVSGAYNMMKNDAYRVRVQIYDPTSGADVSITPTDVMSADSWHYIVAVWDRDDKVYAYVNSIGYPATAVSITNYQGVMSNAVSGRIGKQGTDSYPFPGKIDEVRISNVARGTNWIATSYSNQVNPAAFLTYGAVRQVGLGMMVVVY